MYVAAEHTTTEADFTTCRYIVLHTAPSGQSSMFAYVQSTEKFVITKK